MTRSRIKIFDRSREEGPVLTWQASLQEVRQFFRVDSGNAASMIIVTANPVLAGAGRREKRKLGPLFDFTGRFPVVLLSSKDSRELWASSWLELHDRGECSTAYQQVAEQCPSLLAEHETLCRHYDLSTHGGVWLTTHRLIVRKTEWGNTVWECGLTDLEGMEQWRLSGSTLDLSRRRVWRPYASHLLFLFRP